MLTLDEIKQSAAGTVAAVAARLPRLGGSKAAWPPRRLSLALQGGGSFGAFTWGVLDRLLEDPDISFDTISGASAGAVNAVLLASGLAAGSRTAAREQLEAFWRRASELAPVVPFSSGSGLDLFAGRAQTLSMWTRILSPVQLNPLDLNPLRTALKDVIDFERLRQKSPVRLMLAATRVRDGHLRIFEAHETTPDVVLASACLPLIHHPVLIEGEAYWDGGYSANPPLLRLVADTFTPDVLLVEIIPTHSDTTPTASHDILRRLDHITFSATLRTEIDVLSRYSEMCSGFWGLTSRRTRKQRRLKLHKLKAEDEIEGLAEASALNLDWNFLTQLRDKGREAARAWLANEQARPRPLLVETARRHLRQVA